MVKNKVDCEDLQEYLFKVGEWAIMQQMKFSAAKCPMVHIGTKLPNFKYMLMGSS